MNVLYNLLLRLMDGCYGLCHNYGWAIVLFTFISKIVLLPVSLWTYMNSIKMIKIQPDINFIKVKYYGQKDEIAEEQSKLYKKTNYHPLASTIPLIIQLILLMGVVGTVRAGIGSPNIDMSFGAIDLGLIPSEIGMSLIWSPLIAGLSSWVLCVAQNANNVLQAEQSKYNKYGMMVFSVGLSLYLGWYVPIATALYWICSNLMAIVQLYIFNILIRPKRFVDYEKLEESRKELKELQNIGKKKRESFFSENKKRERKDYKRFFSVVNKHLVFYSESNGFYKYFKGILEYLLEYTNITIHYITSDPNDSIFEMSRKNSQIRSYYIGENKLITLMMKMDADMVVMTMPDLDNYHIKRSYIRNDIEYVFVQHDMICNTMIMRKGCDDNFDTIFCAGPHQKSEILDKEMLYRLPAKKLIEVGYPLIDELRERYQQTNHTDNERKKILIAPSWQVDNIIDSCLEEILDLLKSGVYDIIVRPHPQEVRIKKDYMESLKLRYKSDNIEIQTDFTSNNPIMDADVLITDWSGISFEYAFATYKPVLFIDTPMKVLNPEYKMLDTQPIQILLRNQLGISLKTDELSSIPETIEYLIAHKDKYYDDIDRLAHKYLYNFGSSAEVGAKYIIKSLQEKVAKKGERDEKES